MSRSLSRAQATVLGLVVLAGVGVGGWGLFRIGSQQQLWADRFELTVGFLSVNGVTVGTPVRVRGIDAGLVTGIDPPGPDRPEGAVLLRLRLDRRYQHLLFADAVAHIENEGMIGGKVVILEPGSAAAGALGDGALIASKLPPATMDDVMRQTTELLAEVRKGTGTLGRLLTDDSLYKEAVSLVRDGRGFVQRGQETMGSVRDTVDSMKQDADAIKRLPIVRSYVQDALSVLVRPDCDRHRLTFAAVHLFEPGQASLSAQGKAHLDGLAGWLQDSKPKNSELVVAAYADPKAGASEDVARRLTELQAEAVCTYLRDHHKAGKTGWWFWSTRKVTALGMGTAAPPQPETEPQTPAHVEIIVFVPRS
jgi:outer membrane protein OmpA-like peptidoglycan-associated protein